MHRQQGDVIHAPRLAAEGEVGDRRAVSVDRRKAAEGLEEVQLAVHLEIGCPLVEPRVGQHPVDFVRHEETPDPHEVRSGLRPLQQTFPGLKPDRRETGGLVAMPAEAAIEKADIVVDHGADDLRPRGGGVSDFPHGMRLFGEDRGADVDDVEFRHVFLLRHPRVNDGVVDEEFGRRARFVGNEVIEADPEILDRKDVVFEKAEVLDGEDACKDGRVALSRLDRLAQCPALFTVGQGLQPDEQRHVKRRQRVLCNAGGELAGLAADLFQHACPMKIAVPEEFVGHRALRVAGSGSIQRPPRCCVKPWPCCGARF